VQKKDLTEFKEFKLSSARKRSRSNSEEAPSSAFKARPFNADIFALDPRDSVRRMSSSELKAPTPSKAPRLLTETRANARSQAPAQEEFKAFQARPMPVFSASQTTPSKLVREPLQAQPFRLSTESRGELHKQKEQQRLEAMREAEEQARLFKAREVMHTFAPVPCVEKKSCTDIKEFDLSAARAELARQKFEEEKQRVLEEERKAFNSFKARPHSLNKAPFSAKKSARLLTEHVPVRLQSESRAEARKAFETALREKKAKEVEEAMRLKAEEAMKEAAEIKELRKSLVHKPLPVMSAAPVEVKPSSEPLTEARSPTLRTRLRSAKPTPQV
jgi:hypothetical protein